MSTRRARQHQWIVLRQKAFRRFKRNYGRYYYVWDNQRIGGPRWRAINRVQTERERMISVLYPASRELSQGKMAPGLLQFVTAPFDPCWVAKEDNHDD